MRVWAPEDKKAGLIVTARVEHVVLLVWRPAAPRWVPQASGQSGHPFREGRTSGALSMQPADRGTLMSHQLFLALLAPPVQKEGGKLGERGQK